jgi:hypothetical protein
MKKVVIGAALAAIMLIPVSARAHKGHVHKVMGTVMARHANQLEVKTNDGKTVTIRLDEKTIYERGTQKVDQQYVQVGERVVIDVGDGKTMTARSIKVGTTAATAKK